MTAAALVGDITYIAMAEGKIIGMFRGAMEAGPRALANRSILASPLRPEVVERLNARVKFREPFRLFAPVVLASKTTDYFTLGQPAPFMSFASGVTDLTCASPRLCRVPRAADRADIRGTSRCCRCPGKTSA